jgi:sugar phosphate isomerase/epimerase
MAQKSKSRSRNRTGRSLVKPAAKTKTVTSVSAVSEPTRASTADRPKIGCVSWCFHSFAGGSSPEEAIDLIGDIGFEGVELILLARDDIEGYWTRNKVSQLKKQLERNRLELAQFVIFQPVIEGLTSTDIEERKRNLDYFEAGCRLGKSLGAPLINIVAPWARELRRPGGGYLPRYYELSDPKPGEKFHIEIASGFDWEALWQTYVETTKACLERVKAHGLKLSIEHHTHTMIHDATAFLRLWDTIQDPALGYNLDVGWTLSQREYPPVAIHKVKNQLMNLHVRDIDGLMRQFPHIGEGVMDFKAMAEALKTIGFRGFLCIEQDKHPGDMKATCKRYLNLMKGHFFS